MFTLYRRAVFRAVTKIYTVLYKHLSVTEILLKPGSRSGAKAIHSVKIVLNSRKNEVPSDSSLIHFNLETEFQGQPSQKVFYLHLVILLKSSTAITEIWVWTMTSRQACAWSLF